MASRRLMMSLLALATHLPPVGIDRIACTGIDVCYPKVVNQKVAAAQNDVHVPFIPSSCALANPLGLIVSPEPSAPLAPCMLKGIPSSHELEREKLDELGCCQASALFVEPIVVAAQNPSDCRPFLPVRDFHKDGTLLPRDALIHSQASLATVEDLLKPKEILPADCGVIERPEGVVDPPTGENRDLDCDFDVVSSQSSEDWSAEEIAKDPMCFVLQRLLEEETTQHDLDGLVEGLQNFDSQNCPQLLEALSGVVEDHHPMGLAQEGPWIQANSRRKRNTTRKNSKSSSDSKVIP
ncbi:hypothetical protein Nepgr_024038 [Nepenthes gracilis]|uniref:Uncharacterized protein n=1 Tax=Nepenthes gracilis TaxID=150966 RepID=A0AAD3T3N3_NEPGR|nr:hypothetical protein Nepgr_024038 [Nepenthes gracilis]